MPIVSVNNAQLQEDRDAGPEQRRQWLGRRWELSASSQQRSRYEWMFGYLLGRDEWMPLHIVDML